MLVGAVAGGFVGALAFALFLGLGGVLMSRVGNLIPLVIAAIAGAYAAWLLGVVVFGAVRGTDKRKDEA